MSTPVALAILQSLQAALQAVAIAGGYNFDVKASSVVLDPQDLTAVASTETPFFVLADGKLRTEGGTSRPVAVKSYIDVSLCARVDAASADKDAKTIAAWTLYADIEKALLVDPQRGGLALYTYPDYENQTAFYYGLPAQTFVLLEIPVRVALQRAYGHA